MRSALRPRSRRELEPLRHPAFVRLWLARSVSQLGSRISFIALILFVTTDLGGAHAVGVVLAAYALPLVLLLLLGGVFADRLPRPRLMAATDALRCLLHAGVAALILTGEASLLGLTLIGALFGASEAFSRPAATGLMPQTVPERLIQPASALLALVDNVADFAGPVLATALVTTVGAGYAFAIDAASFAISAALVVSICPRQRSRSTPRAAVVGELAEGFRVLRARPWACMMLFVAGGVLFCGMAPWMVAGPTATADSYGSAALFGLLSGGVGVGMILGALLGSRWRPASPLVTGIAGLALWPLFLAATALGVPLPLALCLSGLAGAALTLANVWWETILTESIPPGALSRVAAWDWLVSLGLLPLGYLAAGPAAAALGASSVILVGAFVCVLVIAGALLPHPRSGLKQLRPEGLAGPA